MLSRKSRPSKSRFEVVVRKREWSIESNFLSKKRWKKKEKKRKKDVKDAEEKCVYDGSTQDILKSRWTLIFQVFIFFFLFFPSFFPFAPQRVRIQARSNEIHCTFSYMSKEKKKREHTYTYTYTQIHRYIYIHIHVRWRASCSIV